MSAEEHHFDRRASDASVAALATLPEMEWRAAVLRLMSSLQRQVDENTDITADTQQVLNRDVLGKLDEMYDAFAFARDGLMVLAKIGRGVANVGRWIAAGIEMVGRLAKPLFWIVAVGAAVVAWFKTGTWAWPEWIK